MNSCAHEGAFLMSKMSNHEKMNEFFILVAEHDDELAEFRDIISYPRVQYVSSVVRDYVKKNAPNV